MGIMPTHDMQESPKITSLADTAATLYTIGSYSHFSCYCYLLYMYRTNYVEGRNNT